MAEVNECKKVMKQKIKDRNKNNRVTKQETEQEQFLDSFVKLTWLHVHAYRALWPKKCKGLFALL